MALASRRLKKIQNFFLAVFGTGNKNIVNIKKFGILLKSMRSNGVSYISLVPSLMHSVQDPSCIINICHLKYYSRR